MRIPSLFTATCLGLWLSTPGLAAESAPSKAEVETVIDQTQAWLASKQLPDGSFSKSPFSFGVTALATTSLAAEPKAMKATDPVIAKSLAFLLANQQADGGFYVKEQGLGNYCTSITLMALAAAGQLTADKDQVAKAQQYLFGLQRADGSNMDGGIGYDQNDGKDHQDLPNETMAIAGLRASGVPSSDPHMQKALKFLEHCQNLSSVNPAKWVDNGPSKGSAVYSPNESQANGSFQEPANKSDPVKTLTGTGSMTYSLISSYVSLDLKPEDPRVAAALDWCKRNYRFDANPGMTTGHEHEGMLYYYLMLAKTMHVLGLKQLTLADGTTVDWRADLFKAITSHGKSLPLGEGKTGMMFMNDAQRWGETFPHLATAYLLQALKDIDASL